MLPQRDGAGKQQREPPSFASGGLKDLPKNPHDLKCGGGLGSLKCTCSLAENGTHRSDPACVDSRSDARVKQALLGRSLLRRMGVGTPHTVVFMLTEAER
jgi:hypothetical protein